MVLGRAIPGMDTGFHIGTILYYGPTKVLM